MRLVLLSTIYIFTDVKSVSVYFFVLRFICLSFSHFDSLLCCCHLTTFYRYSQNTTDWYETCVCVDLVGVHFSLFRCISVSLLAFKRAICHLFTSSTPINFIYFFASFFFCYPFYSNISFFSFAFVRLIQHSFSRSTLFDCWLFDFVAWKMDWKHLSTQSSVLIAKRIRWLQNLCVYLGDSDIAMESYGALERLNDRVWRKLIE